MRGYDLLFCLLVISFLLGLVIEGVSYLLGKRESEREKLTGFECGFDAFESSRERFDIHFYLVGMLFIIFDIEASFIFPWSVVYERLGDIGMVGMIDFILELVLGLIYIYRLRVLN